MKWPNGFMCPHCGHDYGIGLHCRELTECSHCHKQTSVMLGTLFHGSHLPLLKWFWALYFIGSDKGSISVLRLSKLIEVNWKTARLMLTKVRAAMGHRDSLYRLSGTISEIMPFLAVSTKARVVVEQKGKPPLENCQHHGLISMKMYLWYKM